MTYPVPLLNTALDSFINPSPTILGNHWYLGSIIIRITNHLTNNNLTKVFLRLVYCEAAKLFGAVCQQDKQVVEEIKHMEISAKENIFIMSIKYQQTFYPLVMCYNNPIQSAQCLDSCC